MAIVKHNAGTAPADVVIWAETKNINFFLKTPLTPAIAAGVVDKQTTVKTHTRRQYPGDSTPANVAGHPREWMYDPGARNGAALPGKPFTLVADAGLPGEERRTFTYVGRFAALHAFLKEKAKMKIDLYGPTGKHYRLDAATTQTP